MIIGAMKAGTTSLYSSLVRHPQVCGCVVKEPEFFSQNQAHATAAQHYSELWPGFSSRVHKIALEASTGYSKFPMESGVPERIAAYGIRPRVIYVLRNPFDRIASHVEFMPPDAVGSPVHPHVLSLSDYYLQLERWRPHLPADKLLLLDFDELKQQPGRVVARVCKFLQIDDLSAQLPVRVQNVTQPMSLGRRLVRRLAYSSYAPRFVPNMLRSATRLGESRRPRLTQEQLSYAQRQLAPSMQRLSIEYGVAIERWGFD